MNNIIHQYENGNYEVSLFQDGTKIRQGKAEKFIPIRPESIDVKITNYCDMGCKYCHEASTKNGKHGDIETLFHKIKDLKGLEVAIGGGNPLDHPELLWFLDQCEKAGIVCNITINENHVKERYDKIINMSKYFKLHAIGVSINSKDYDMLKEFQEEVNSQVVYHMIMGIHSIEDLAAMRAKDLDKVLLLGYKQFGFGRKYYQKLPEEIETKIYHFKTQIQKFFDMHLSFDNLGIEQINLKRFFKEDYWNEHYMGDDFQFTMYIDAVRGTYAPTSRSEHSKRVDWHNMSVVEYFKNHGNE